MEAPAGLACRLSWPCARGTWVDPARRTCPTSGRAYRDWEINPLSRASRRAEALGYARRSPPARAIPDYFFKDHNFGLHSASRARRGDRNEFRSTRRLACPTRWPKWWRLRIYSGSHKGWTQWTTPRATSLRVLGVSACIRPAHAEARRRGDTYIVSVKGRPVACHPCSSVGYSSTHAGETPALPGFRHAGETPALPGSRRSARADGDAEALGYARRSPPARAGAE